MPGIKDRSSRSKKTVILEYRQAHTLNCAGMEQIAAIQAELRTRLGERGKTAPSYIARVLRELGTRVEIPPQSRNPYASASTEEPYATRLTGVLQFSDLPSAENSLRNLDAAYREYLATADRVGVRHVRELALKGKLRAQSLGANSRVSIEKREEKQEIASWFRVWLQSPDLFFDWLALRKNSEDFQRRFTSWNQSSPNESHPDHPDSAIPVSGKPDVA